jgi:nucleoside-diphosphate-sugar epimerase
MKVFITGGTGFIGNRLADRLISENHDVVMLIRDKGKAANFTNGKVTFTEGNLLDVDSLKRGMKGCDWVFHMAAFTKPWSKDPSMAYNTNVTGTINIFEAALECKVGKVVFTSTGGTMSYSRDGNPVGESTNTDPDYHTVYEMTKAEAERIAVAYCQKGLYVVIVNPTRVYGPGKLSKSNSMTKIIKLYISGLWRIIPGNGKSVGNYVYIDDVVEGHILAARSGRSGERYILGGENLTFRELFGIIGEAAGKKRRVFPISLTFIKIFIRLGTLITKVTGMPPLITRDWLDKYMNDWIMSSNKAIEEINYKITPFTEGVTETITWLKSRNNGDK